MCTAWGPEQPRSIYNQILSSSLTPTVIITTEGNDKDTVLILRLVNHPFKGFAHRCTILLV